MTNVQSEGTLVGLIDRILDKGLIINADIKIDLAGTEFLGIKLRAALASFETAAKFGLAFPSGTNLHAPAWKMLGCENNICPKCGSLIYTKSQHICACGWEKTVINQKEKQIEVSKI